MAWLLLVAGHETTVNLITNGVHNLLAHPGQLAALRADFSLIDNAVEESCASRGRWRPHVPLHHRADRGGRHSDPRRRRTGPGRDVGRQPGPRPLPRRGPLRHHPGRPGPCIAFGHGIHYCLGAPLARIEARTAIRSLLERCPDLRLTADPGDADLAHRNADEGPAEACPSPGSGGQASAWFSGFRQPPGISSIATGRRSRRETSHASAIRRACRASRPSHGLASSPRTTRRSVQLSLVRQGEPFQEARPGLRRGAGAAGLGRGQRRTVVEADGDLVRFADQLHPYVVPGAVAPGRGGGGERPVVEGEQGRWPCPRPRPPGTSRAPCPIRWRTPRSPRAARHPAQDVEVVDQAVAVQPAGEREVGGGRRRGDRR